MKEKLRKYITTELISDRGDLLLGDEDDLLGGGVLDSIAMMSLILFVESEFDLSIPPQDVTIENFESLQSIDAYVRRRRVSS